MARNTVSAEKPADLGAHARVVDVVVVRPRNQLRQRRRPARQQHRRDVRRIRPHAREQAIVGRDRSTTAIGNAV